MSWQSIATGLTVVGAALYLLKKLVLEPATRSRKPDVPTSRLVRKRRDGGGACDHGE